MNSISEKSINNNTIQTKRQTKCRKNHKNKNLSKNKNVDSEMG